MGLKTPITHTFQVGDGPEITIETGKLASQAHGSCVLRVGKMMIFASVVSSYKSDPTAPFFPLFVDYQEKFAAVGRIPGNFFRREAKLSTNEILISRLVDRAIRPLFPEGYMSETQVFINLISGDPDIKPDAYVALAVSTALSVSDIPWEGPISEVRVARVSGQYVVNPSKESLESADMDLVVAATEADVMMVEGEAHECSEEDLVDAIRTAHEAIKLQCQAQHALAQKVGEKALNKREFEVAEIAQEIKTVVSDYCRAKMKDICDGALNKLERKKRFELLSEEFSEYLNESQSEEWLEEHEAAAKKVYDKLKKEVIREQILTDGVRLDGRKTTDVRSIWTEIDYLPSAHGSAIFTRGETQSLTSLTLGSKKDEQMIDDALDFHYDKFFLHYNFPALSVGEIKALRGPGRREIGHANLAKRALSRVMPDNFPYTVRLVSDILESNGSSSMATVCAGSLALMDGGVPIKKPVAGIAMGLVKEGDRHAILSDILGDEDAVGDLDFKVTGTADGITACQMDMKIDGLPYELLIQALKQAREGRLHILAEMAKTIDAPREDLKSFVPRIEEISIRKEFIGAIIGPGGKNIQELQQATNTTISIEEIDERGYVQIMSEDAEGMKEAVRRIQEMTYEPQVGDVHDSVVVSIKPYGVFVDFKGNSGLLHVSEMSWSRIDKVEDHFKEGDEVKIKIIGVDERSGKLRLSRKALLPRPERTNA